MNEIIKVVSDLIFSVLSCYVYDKAKNVISNTVEKKRQDNIKIWISKFFADHVEAVFESSQFENYLKYNKPFDTIAKYVKEAYKNDATVLEGTFINSLAEDCRKEVVNQGGKCSSPEESSIRDLFRGVLSLIKAELHSELSEGEQLISYQVNQNHLQMNDMQTDLREIKSIFSAQTLVTNSAVIENAYQLMSKAISCGDFEMVYDFLPIINGKSEDLEKSIRIKLDILSKYDMHIEDQYAELNSILNSTLRDDIIRTLIVEYYFQPEKIVPIIGLISDNTLKEIAKAVSESHIEHIISKTVNNDNGKTVITFEFLIGYKTEKVLVNKLLMLYITALSGHCYNFLKNTIVEPDIFDYIYIWESRFYEAFFLALGRNYDENNDLIFLLKELRNNVENYYKANKKYAARFYSLLLKTTHLVCPKDFNDTMAEIPSHISNEIQIVEIQMMLKIHTGEVSPDEVLDFALKNDRYNVVVEYFVCLENSEKIIELIDQAKLMLNKDIRILLLYVDAVSKTKCKKEALSLLRLYETDYNAYSTFWIKAYVNSEDDNDRQWAINSLVDVIESQTICHCSVEDVFSSIEMLLNERKNGIALKLMNDVEHLWGLEKNADFICLKIQALMLLSRQIETLDEMDKHHHIVMDNMRLLDMYLCLSINNNRLIPEDVFSRAKNSNNARILLLVAEVEYNNNNIDAAKCFAMKSLLNMSEDNAELSDSALKFFVGDDNTNGSNFSRIDANMSVDLETESDGSAIRICVYKERIPPHSGYKWMNAVHAYIDDEIGSKLVRLSVGETVEYNNAIYKVTGIAPIEAFYFNVCMNSMINRQIAFSVSAESLEDFEQGIIGLFQAHPEFNNKHTILDRYKDLEESPPTIYSIAQGTNIEYAQLSRLIMEDTSVIVREYILPFGDYNVKEFVLTYTALVALHYLGVTIQECTGCNSVIPSSVIIEAEKEAKKIYAHNNRESVMTMGVISNDLIVSETSENDKRIAISVSNSFKTFVSGFESVDNKNDIQIPEFNNDKLKFLLGICDYDSIVIAHQRNAVLITGEMVLARFTQLNETKADVAGIADFLCLLRLPAIRLISLIAKMIKYRFNAAITPTVIIYLSNCYDNSDESTQKRILQGWRDLLQSLNEITDEKQRSNYKSTCVEVIKLLHGFKQGEGHPIVRQYIMFSFHFNDYRIQLSIEKGELVISTYHIDNANPSTPSEPITKMQTSILNDEDHFPDGKL